MVTTATYEGPGASAWPVLLRVADATRVLNLSRSVVYDLIRTGRLRTVTEGRTRLVPASAIGEYVALLEREAGEAR
ncbi:helix-turn-helix domain-containing protein [Streptomyces montanisoli]|uniref:Helix-turn-helix domain-containing protein n=1 Tax=Streptomyces montanisoli TaxID=2798581 RepID=A0A940MIH4_9ACTN|nr:helix-turn-helix domain-containing protein [Streptomyces montanisoli]MBP0460826.1 helix-turn-helix domain-containing protein [Streptomyces montanisoli]